MRRGDGIKNHEACVVAMAGKGFAHIAKADEEKHDARPEALECLRANNPRANMSCYFLPFGGAFAGAPAGAAAAGVAARLPTFCIRGGGGRRRGGGSGGGLFRGDERRRDRRNREIAFALGRLAAFRQGKFGDMHRIIDLQSGEIGDDRFGNVIGRNPHFNRVTDDVQAAALLDAGADVLVEEMHRHLDAQTCSRLQPQEIDMERLILDRIELVIARNDALLRAIRRSSSKIVVRKCPA